MGKSGRSEWIKLGGPILIEGNLKLGGRALKWLIQKTKSGLSAKVDGPKSESGGVSFILVGPLTSFFDKNEGSSKEF